MSNNMDLFAKEETGMSEPLKVWIHTRSFRIEGVIHLAKTGRDERRLTNLLNSEKRFLAITDAVLYKKVEQTEPVQCDFIQLNINQIELIQPMRRKREQ